MKFLLFSAAFLFIATAFTGCDEGHDVKKPTSTVGVDIEVDAGAEDTPIENRAERRQDRRENLREALDDIDVNVGDGGVDVNVGDGEKGVDILID